MLPYKINFILFFHQDSRWKTNLNKKNEEKVINSNKSIHTLSWHAGVYILSQNFIIAPRGWARDENFYNCPQFEWCEQWNILKFAHFVPIVLSI